ncbi:hypothetical protein SCUCBS95973_005089 [Sporothrix curviconia]|uniref:Uncharacterized protein n=1 Tax=Sporothrix curviconia TaxID=1260050 RepID=A0ABP0BUA1_9PEZI
MDRDHVTAAVHGMDEIQSRKGRLMGKLFGGRDRKASNELRHSGGDDEINAFLHGSPGANAGSASPRSSTTMRPSFDGFTVAHSAPPQLSKLDTRAISRYPNAVPVSGVSNSPISSHFSSKPRRQGARNLAVRFVDAYPEIIGEGGDESEIPPAEIGRRRRTNSVRAARPHPAPLTSFDGAVPMSTTSTRSLPLRSPLPPLPPQNGPLPQQQQQQQQRRPPPPSPLDNGDNFVPQPVRRTQTGFSSIAEPSPRDDHPRGLSPERRPQASPEKLPGRQLAAAPFLDAPAIGRDERRRSFIEIHQAEMREAEGLALLKNLRDGVSPPSSPEIDEKKPVSPVRYSPTKMTPPPSLPPPRHPRHNLPPQAANPEVSPILPQLSTASTASTPDGASFASRSRQAAQEYSPPAVASPTSAVHRAYNSFRQNASSRLSNRERDDDSTSVYSGTSAGSATSPRPPMADLHDVVQATGDDAFNTFISRSRHLFELFRLQSETIHPLSASSADDLARAALWWFIIGRMALENAFRERSAQKASAASAGGGGGGESPVSRANEAAMQQAYADLAKAYWLAGEILPDTPSPAGGEAEQVCKALMYNLRKLSISMKRNNILPPEDAFLPAIIDKTIWVSYPSISSDVTALLQGNWNSSLTASPVSAAPMPMLESLPIADSTDDFIFSRMWADVYLMETGRDSSPHPTSKFHFPCLLSVARPQNSAMLEIIVASQNEKVQLRVQGRKNPGPMWEDVSWRSDLHSLEMRLPRGFLLAIQLSKQDYGLLWSMYDFGSKVHSQLYPRSGENPIFRTTLKAFQYFESGQATGSFPKEAVPDCDVGLFEKTLQENAATGRRYYHRGFRIALVSGTRTRTLYGVTHTYLPDMPVQFSFLRGDQGDPALLLKFETSRNKGSMVLTFGHIDERAEFHSLLAGTALRPVEQVTADVPISSLDMRIASGSSASSGGGGSSSSSSGNKALSSFKQLAFKRLRVVNIDDGIDGTKPPTVLAEHLRMIFEFGDCTVVDRINAAPGELKIRLDVRDHMSLVLVRQAQQDFTVAISDVQVPRELGRELAEGLRVAKAYPTCRALRFASLSDLHAVQQAITGYKVLFDGVATTFGIARRRMVVPIHKKWEAGLTRIQVVVHADTKLVQLLAFFQDFHYGHCMGFVLRGTDVYEAFGRGSKAGIKFDDAKFSLPRLPAAGRDSGGAGDSGDGGAGDGIMGNSETAFVCLDMPDLPGEHDDISILFDKEAERDRFAACLPAPVRGSRLAKMF